jgi:hypothetical protein
VPILSVVPFPTYGAAGAAVPPRLPTTAGDTDVAAIAAIAAVLFVIGVVLCVTPRAVSTRRKEKE